MNGISDGCKSVLIYEGAKEEYISFLAPEASMSLDNYLDQRSKDKKSLLFWEQLE